MTKLQKQQAIHRMAHVYLNLESLLKRDDVMVDSVAGAEIERLASLLRDTEREMLKAK
jgi:hypothetical protein